MSKTKTLGVEIGEEMNIRDSAIHVIKHTTKGWCVKRTGAKRCLKTFSDLLDAITYAKNFGRKNGLTVFYHDKNGWVYDREIFRKGRK